MVLSNMLLLFFPSIITENFTQGPPTYTAFLTDPTVQQSQKAWACSILPAMNFWRSLSLGSWISPATTDFRFERQRKKKKDRD